MCRYTQLCKWVYNRISLSLKLSIKCLTPVKITHHSARKADSHVPVLHLTPSLPLSGLGITHTPAPRCCLPAQWAESGKFPCHAQVPPASLNKLTAFFSKTKLRNTQSWELIKMSKNQVYTAASVKQELLKHVWNVLVPYLQLPSRRPAPHFLFSPW